MKMFWAACGALMLACCGVNGGVMRDLQHEIDAINILLTENQIDPAERAFLLGKSSGIFLAMEIINENGDW